MEKKSASVVVNNLTTGYFSKKGEIVVTENINAALFPGEVTCLLGPNGSGKSTLLKTLTSFIKPLSGTVSILGKDIRRYSALELSKAVGVVLTEKPDLNNMTTEELVKLGRSPYTGFWGHMSREDKISVRNAFDLVGINSLKNRMIQTLSDGERQKVMIAKALAQQTPLIFLDEPTAFLDYPSKVEIIQILRKLAIDQNKTVFLSIHDLELALQTADKIWLLDKSHGVTIGTPEDLAGKNEIERYFHRDGIKFDAETGLFKIINAGDSEVFLSGSGLAYNLALRALSRKGINISDMPGKMIKVNADDDGIVVNGYKCDSIEEMLHRVSCEIEKIKTRK